ncbi:MAG: SusC/RagA family TonB-linked outer membrane protein [Cyclobacteriaceae bacterium]|nr:SusC/RagA family TonB-linked outer membrane protein [Cyclobacteriaceae bacterium]
MTKFYLLVKKVLPVLFLVACYGMSMAQGRTVSGKVTSSDDGSSVPGVNILEKGTSNGTVSDSDGNYKISVGENATLVFSFVGYASQEVAVGSQAVVNATLQSDVTALSEVVVVGYGSQDKKEITGSVVALSTKDFNRGNINDPTQLLQGKVAGLSIYNRGGDPNTSAIVRLRGISTVGANSSPLVVIDGVLGASLDNVDPNDIESINVLKDGSAAAIYGSRASSGVILVTTKRGSKTGALSVTYNGYVAAQTVYNQQPVMTASQYVAAGGNNLGSVTDWQKEVTQTGVSNVHNIAISGGNKSTTFRLSTNLRNVNGVLKKSGFDQINARANITHSALNDKLKIDLSMSLTTRNSNFSFNDALRYAVLFNPTAPVKFPNGNYYQAILFDNFNPVAIIDQNINEGKKKTMNYNAKVDYSITDNITLTVNAGQQNETVLNGEYYSRASLFRGYNRGGLARRYTSDRTFSLFEGYGTYSKTFNKINFDASIGYSFQEDKFQDIFIQLGDFPNDLLGYNAIGNSGDRISGILDNTNVTSSVSPNNRIIATFARVNLTFDNAIFFNASIRREGSTKLGKDNQYGIFPAVGLGVDLNKYLQFEKFDMLKLRVGYGVTGSLPNDAGLAQDLYSYSFASGGSISKTRAANKDLKWEQKQEINLGIDFSIGGKLSGTLDLYTRNINDFILERTVEVATYGASLRTENAGSLKTNGAELSLNYNSLRFGEISWTPGIVLSSYKTTLESFIIDEQVRANLGAPGQNGTNIIRVKVGEEIGQIWGPVFAGVEGNGAPRFADLNGDGVVVSDQASSLLKTADFKQLGSGIPSLELGWKNQLTYRNWDLNVFFRGAFGHSLVNNFRAFYEPIDPGAINSYNRIATSKAVAGLTSAQFSSLYVEKADFLKLDNLTLGYNFKMGSSSAVKNVRVYFSGQNLFVITSYTGIDPEPVLADPGTTDNGGFPVTTPADVLSPGIDRRNNYFTSRTFTFGLNIGL